MKNRGSGLHIGLLAWLALALGSAGGAQSLSQDFVQVREGHLWRGGKRLRLWAVNVQGLNRAGHSTRAKVDDNLQRIQDMGFNAVRLWGGNVLCEVKDEKRIYHTYTKGDGSPLDLMDYFIARLREKGFIIWLTWLDYHAVVPQDADLVDEPATRERWVEAVRQFQKPEFKPGQGLIFYFDPRAKAAFKDHITQVLNHVNQWTGTAIKDEPAVGVYELDNERQFMDNMLGPKGKAGFGHSHVEEILPGFFVEELQQQWNRFLKSKYATDATLAKAWGRLEPDESLALGTVRLQPTYATASNYPEVRGEDIVTFYRQLFVDTCGALREHIRKSDAPNRGCAVVPVIFHTIASVHGLHIAYSNSFADAVAYGNYWMQYADEERCRKKPPLRYPWYTFVEGGPGWGFIHPYKQADKPLLLYEVNCHRSDRFRAEFPLLHALGGCWSDLDAICFYQWDYHFSRDLSQLVNDRLYYPTTDHGWHGVTTYSDEVSLAALLTAGRIFLQGLLSAPASPTIVRYGRKELHNLRQKWYGPLHRVFPTALRHGVRIAFDPKVEETVVQGPTVKEEDWNAKEWRVGEDLVWDINQGQLIVDLPAVKAAAGFLPPELVFRGDVKVQGVRKLWADPDDITPLRDVKAGSYRPYYAFTLVSDDGLPLAQSRRILLSLVSTSQNAGFAFDPSRVPHTGPDAQKMAQGILSPGAMPVLVNRVGASITAPFLRGKRYAKLDFSMRRFEEGEVKDKFSISPSDPLFLALIASE